MDQSFHITNWVVALLFLPLFLFENQTVNWSLIWMPLVMGVIFFFGTWTTFLGIRIGDVSLVTPLMGTKVVFVAIGVVVTMGQMPSNSLWLAAIFTTLGIFLMGWRDFRSKATGMTFAILITLLSAALFGFSDVLVTWWANDFGPMAFLTMSTLSVALCSFIMWIIQGRPGFSMPAAARKPTVLAGILIGLQAIGMGIALSFFDDATGINVVYASRGLWAIVLIGLFGVWLGNHERHTSGKTFWWRAVGTLFLTAAVIIAVLDRSA